MKRFLLLSTFGVLALGANAQFKQNFTPVSGGENFHKIVRPVTTPRPVNKTTSGGGRWYNAAFAYASANQIDDVTFDDADHAALCLMWQDSTVRYSDDTTIGITYQSMAQMFQPQATVFTDPTIDYNAGQIGISNSDAYTIDSVKIRGRYERQYTGYTDTMILRVVYETSSMNFAEFSFDATTTANHGIDTFSAILWDLSDYQTNPVTQIPYSTGTGKTLRDTTFIIPLNDATFADSSADGLHEIATPVGLSMLAGKKASVSATFKSGTNYVAGQADTAYNYFAFMSHKTNAGDFVTYFAGDRNISYMLTKDSQQVNTTLGLYYPTIGFTNQAYPYELHDVSWKVTCNTCNTTGINTPGKVVAVKAYPNPAINTVNIPVTVSDKANVEVSLINTIGQVVDVKSLGNVNAGQTATATFSTAKLANGIYIYSVNADGQRTTGRIAVSH
ncbi:T9SS type A sorting domain-containing protein [Taibaiella soli]|uniref:Secretion system C-terminal sorting domain-containing protein n=1 Tax=Taibaiella soli TaxID=1649169 RepID=A0A2W2AWU0_9BACT|nr:T9SS type A sorting domain-containing protein [Taibaiella soli]PZF72444.1 hypothetical protein DN068_13920 [Taibaiella soli]